MKNFVKNHLFFLIVLLLFLSTSIGGIYCYVKHVTQTSPKNVTVECVRKENGQSSSYGGFPTTKIYFEIHNNGKETLHDLDATINITSKNSDVTLLHEEMDNVFLVDTFIYPGESENMYLYLYDIKVDSGGIENFEEIYKSDISDLNIDFKVNSIELAFAPLWKTFSVLLGIISVIILAILVPFVRTCSADIIYNLRRKQSTKMQTKHVKSAHNNHIKSEHDIEWYFSDEGVKAYADLSSNLETVKFFLEYLLLIAKKPQNFTMLYRLAYVMASSMVGSSLEFGGYPNVLDESKNPLIKFIKKNKLIGNNNGQGELSDDKGYCYSAVEKQMIKLLCALHDETEEYTQQCLIANDPFKCLTFCNENTPVTEMYKIERELIYMFSNGMDADCKNCYVPYATSVMLLNGRLE